MAKSGVLVSLPQMVDLALNSPEVGAVNFNILHSLLHVLIQQVDLLECKVEFVGSGSEKLQHLLANSKPGPSLNLTEYIVTPGKDQRKVITKKSRYKKVRVDETKKSSKEEVVIERELRVIEQRKDSKQEPLERPSPLLPLHNEGSTTSMQTVVMVEPTETAGTAHVSVALSRVHFDNLEDEIEKLKMQIKELKELPANMGLIDALRNSSVDKSSPVVDMFQILTISKRIDATEQGIQKLASMIEDLAKESQNLQLITVMETPEERKKLKSHGNGSSSGIPDDLLDRIDHMGSRLDKLESSLQGAGLEKLIQQISSAVESSGGAGAGAHVQNKSAPSDDGSPGSGVSEDRGGGASAPDRFFDLESKLNDYTEQIATLDTMFNTQIVMLQSQFNDLEKEMGEIVERINAGFPGGDTGASDASLAELYKKINSMQAEMENVTNMATKLSEEKSERQMTMDAIVEQVELLKTIKANREDLEDALADKADACMVNRKVSHDQFDAACDDLSRGIEDALTKLTQQEQLWQQALDDIQKEIETKLDKMELTPLRDFVHNKLKMLQERLKALASLKKETEAAGTKSKYLRNVNCISCDKDVVMRKQMDPTLMPPPPALPPTKSMAPYLAYELDALRKQQKCMPHSRNMNHFENAMAGGKGGQGEDHICNRYCGGSHTVTTPQQRVARLGHFLEQWGPETSPVNEGQIKGTDGQMYKSRGKHEGKSFKFESQDMDDGDGYIPNMKSRPSMMVQGGILSHRGGTKSESKTLEVEEVHPIKLESSKEEKKASVQRISVTHRVSADLSGKRTSRSSAARASGARVSGARTSSIKKASITPSMGSASQAPPPSAEEIAPAEDALAEESSPEPDDKAPEEEEAAPAESPEEEAPPEAPAEDAPPDEEPPTE